MTRGLYFRLGYTYAHAIDDGQDALVAGRPATVQNSYSPVPNAATASPIREADSSSPGSTNPDLNGGKGWLGKISKG